MKQRDTLLGSGDVTDWGAFAQSLQGVSMQKKESKRIKPVPQAPNKPPRFEKVSKQGLTLGEIMQKTWQHKLKIFLVLIAVLGAEEGHRYLNKVFTKPTVIVPVSADKVLSGEVDLSEVRVDQLLLDGVSGMSAQEMRDALKKVQNTLANETLSKDINEEMLDKLNSLAFFLEAELTAKDMIVANKQLIEQKTQEAKAKQAEKAGNISISSLKIEDIPNLNDKELQIALKEVQAQFADQLFAKKVINKRTLELKTALEKELERRGKKEMPDRSSNITVIN